jgi:hypothetical protein
MCRISEVIKAAAKLGVDQEEIDDMEIWKGDELGEVKLNERGEWVAKFPASDDEMEGVEKDMEPEPDVEIKEIYEEGTPYFLRLQVNTDDTNAIGELKNLNSRIQEKNKSYGVEGNMVNRFLINYETLVANFKMASSSILSLRNNPMDVKARKRFNELNNNLKAFCTKNSYPQSWVMIPPPDGYQYRVHKEATPYMRILIRNVDDADALAELTKANEKIVQRNKERKYPEDQWNDGIIRDDVMSIFRLAAPFIDRLANSADEEAKTKFDELNEQLRLVNILYHYPSDWVMTTLLEEIEEPSAAADPKGKVKPPVIPNTIVIGEDEASTSAQSSPSAIPRALIIGGEKPGWVFDRGIDKKIRACFKVGSGYRLLFSQPGKNGFPISELIPAGAFGKGVAKSYLEMAGSKEVTIGDAEKLRGLKNSKMYVSAVASVRRNPANEPEYGWKTKPVTYTRLTPFGSPFSLDDPWFARSTLAQDWGQLPTDTTLKAFRDFVGQEDYEFAEDESAANAPERDAWGEKRDAQAAWKKGKALTSETNIEKIERLKTDLAMLLEKTGKEAPKSAKKGKAVQRQPTDDGEV